MRSNSLVVSTLNLFNYCAPPFSFYQVDSCYSIEKWTRKEHWLNDVLAAVTPTIIGFQEVFSPKQLEKKCHAHALNHFAIAESPVTQDDNEFLFIRPVVALASQFPIIKHESFNTFSELTPFNLPIPFSRKPIKAIVEHPKFGEIRVYVVHLKSQRPADITLINENHDVNSEIGRLLSHRQRQLEALQIYIDFMTTQIAHPLPTFILGDFNQSIYRSDLHYLLDSQGKINTVHDHHLVDSFNLTQQGDKMPTHFYRGEGKCLDYILCNKTLLSTLACHNVNYSQFDKYIDKSDAGFGPTSDHACVSITLS